MTQEQFAEMIDIAPRNLNRIEVGESFVTADTLDKILVALDVTAEELFSYEYLKNSEDLLKDIYNYLDVIKNNHKLIEKIYIFINLIKKNEI